jgi:hypothetical protein
LSCQSEGATYLYVRDVLLSTTSMPLLLRNSTPWDVPSAGQQEHHTQQNQNGWGIAYHGHQSRHGLVACFHKAQQVPFLWRLLRFEHVSGGSYMHSFRV